ncbi:MAG: phage tail spike protein [Phycisphaerales bacterium]
MPDRETPGPYLWLYDLSGDQVGVLEDVLELELEQRLQSTDELRFAVRGDHPYAAALKPGTVIRYAEDGQADLYYRVRELDQERTGARGVLFYVLAEALWYELGDLYKIGVFNLEAETPASALYWILTDTAWTAAVDQPADSTPHTLETADETVLAVLRRWAGITGYELAFDTEARTVQLTAAVGEDRGAGFIYGRNVTSIKRRAEPPKATVLYPFGANELTIESANPAGVQYVENFDWYTDQGLSLAEARALHTRVQVWVDERFLGAVALYDRAVERLAELAIPTISYEAAVVDIAHHGTIPETVGIGDPVRVIDELLEVDLVTRVVRLVHRPLDPAGDDIELAFLRKIAPMAGEGSSSGRTIDYGNLAVLVDNSAEQTIADTVTPWGSIQLSVAGTTTIVTGATLVGLASGSGTLRNELTVDGVTVGEPIDVAFTDGQQVEASWPSFSADLPEGSHLVQWRAYTVAGVGTVDLEDGGARAWLLTQGAYGVGFAGGASQFITEGAPAIVPAAVTDTLQLTDIGAPDQQPAPSETAPAITPASATAAFTIGLNVIPSATAAASGGTPLVTTT